MNEFSGDTLDKEGDYRVNVIIPIPEHVVEIERQKARQELVEFMKGKEPRSPEVLEKRWAWMESEKSRIGSGAKSMEEQVFLMIRDARNHESAGHLNEAMGILEEALLSAKFDKNVEIEIRDDIVLMLEKKTTFL